MTARGAASSRSARTAKSLSSWRSSSGELSGLLIEDTKGADLEAVHIQRAACVKTDLRVSDDHWIVVESLVFECVFDIQNVVIEDSVGAKRDVLLCLAKGEALYRFEPLAVAVDHADR